MASPRQGVYSLLVLHPSYRIVLGRVSPDAALSLDLVGSVDSLVDGNQQQLLSLNI